MTEIIEFEKAIDTDKPFAFIFNNLHIHAPFGYPGYYAGKYFTHLVLQVFGLFVFNRGALGIGCPFFHLRTVLAKLLVMVGIGRLAAV